MGLFAFNRMRREQAQAAAPVADATEDNKAQAAAPVADATEDNKAQAAAPVADAPRRGRKPKTQTDVKEPGNGNG